MNRVLSMTMAAPLAAALALAAPAAAVTVAFTGSYSNDTPTPAPSPDCAAGQVLVNFNPGNSSAAGTSNLGAFGPSLRHCIQLPPPTSFNGDFSFDFGARGLLSGTYAGTLALTATPGVLDSVVNYLVTGGTGDFQGSSGGFLGVGTLDRRPARPLNITNFNGQLTLPAVPEPATWAMLIAGFGLVGGAARRRRLARAAA